MEGVHIIVKAVKNKTIIAVTGGICSGKSYFVNKLIENNFFVIDSDKIADTLWNNNEILDNLAKLFNLKNDFNLKNQIKNLVFNDKLELKKLNDYMHPIIINKINKEIEKNKGNNLIFLDIPLLYEINYKDYDYSVLVYSKKDLQLQRLIKRDDVSVEMANKIISSQISNDQKLLFADYVIYNNSSISDFDININKFFKELEKDVN